MKVLLIITFLLLNLFATQNSFKISYDSNYAPFSYKQEHQERGLLIDIWKLWAKYNNYNIEFVDGGLWEEAINLAKDEKVDFFLGTNVYEDWMLASDFFYETKISLFAASKNNFLLENNTKLTIGIISKDYKDIILKEFPNANILIYEDYKDSVAALTDNHIDLLFDDKLGVEYFVVQQNQFHLIKPIENFSYLKKIHAISVSKEKIDIFNNGFLKIPISELLELEKKWILNKNEQYFINFKRNINLTKEEKEFLKNNQIKVSISNSWEPFTFISSNNEASGILTEYWNLISEKINLNFENKIYNSFVEQVKSLEDKKSDLVYGIGETSKRKEFAIFSKEYLKFPISIVTKKDENFIENISIIKDKKIAIGNDSTSFNILKDKFPNINFILVNSIKEGLELVSEKKVYAFIDIQPVLLYNISKYNFNDLKISGNTSFDFSLKFMIRDDYKIFESILNKAISSISLNELNTIIYRWENVQFQTKFNYKVFWIIIALVVFISLILISRNYVLNNHNKYLKVKVDEKTKELNEINKNLEELVEIKSKELMQKENILNHQSKMAAMGEMLENIAHQWRQPLSLISTVATAAKLKKELEILTDDEFYETMETINNSSQYLSNTIDDFRNFFSKDKEVSSFNINTPIDKVLYLLKNKLNNMNIQVIRKDENINIIAYKNELIQVILNIINNSIDAFENKNILKKFIFIDIHEKNDKVVLIIKDNAGGIEKEIISIIFEPYFTTKHKSQ
jgi:signal transduction histidine kinase